MGELLVPLPEDSLRDDPLVERLLIQEAEVAGGDCGAHVSHSGSSFTSWNQ